jgi:hypothetical protein
MRWSALVLLVFALGCSDYNFSAAPERETPAAPEVPEPDDDCIESSTAFDIEEVSELQDAFGLPLVQDGLMLGLGAGAIDGDQTWRPVAVKVLVMYPDWYFEFYDDSNELTVNFYPQATPTVAAPLSKTVVIKKSELQWEEILLPANADWSGDDREQMAAWLTFDLRDVVPESGYTTDEYFVSLGWDTMGFPNVGYSNFELNCPQNWTDYGTGAYVQNSGQDCSWPMMKIEIEVLSPGDCD